MSNDRLRLPYGLKPVQDPPTQLVPHRAEGTLRNLIEQTEPLAFPTAITLIDLVKRTEPPSPGIGISLKDLVTQTKLPAPGIGITLNNLVKLTEPPTPGTGFTMKDLIKRTETSAHLTLPDKFDTVKYQPPDFSYQVPPDFTQPPTLSRSGGNLYVGLPSPPLPGLVHAPPVLKKRMVFVGHGREGGWKDLRHYLMADLNLDCIDFNSAATAGKLTQERLDEMLESVEFAFLVMTAENEYKDGTFHARENVIHEIGMFQAKIGPKRAVLLLEEGCEMFSNNLGVTHIPFRRGRMQEAFYEVHRTLRRENLIP